MDDAEAYEQYTREEQPENAEEKVRMHLILIPHTRLHKFIRL